MRHRDRVVQCFLDAVADFQTYCEGRIMCYTYEEPVSIKPNCGVAAECPLFRLPPSRSTIRRWDPGLVGDSGSGCDAYRMLERWKREQTWWVVQFEGCESQEVQAGDVQSAVCVAWWERVQVGAPIDKMFLLEKCYTVRER